MEELQVKDVQVILSRRERCISRASPAIYPVLLAFIPPPGDSVCKRKHEKNPRCYRVDFVRAMIARRGREGGFSNETRDDDGIVDGETLDCCSQRRYLLSRYLMRDISHGERRMRSRSTPSRNPRAAPSE